MYASHMYFLVVINNTIIPKRKFHKTTAIISHFYSITEPPDRVSAAEIYRQ
jgi:hypothetical protein